jgi:hypothetical protein
MAARVGMANLITQLRAACAAGTADFTLGTVTYWSDDQLQSRLDQYRMTSTHVELDFDPTYDAGAWRYYDYQIPVEVGTYLEEDATDSGWALKDSQGNAAPAYAINYQASRITFAADTHGSVYFLNARSYDFNRTAAQIWREKAGTIANAFDWSSDNHKISKSQQYEHYMAKAAEYDQKSGIRVSTLFRTDETWQERW